VAKDRAESWPFPSNPSLIDVFTHSLLDGIKTDSPSDVNQNPAGSPGGLKVVKRLYDRRKSKPEDSPSFRVKY